MGPILSRALAALMCLGANAASAQMGNNTTRIVVPFAPGGGQDVLARVLAPGLGEALGETVIVDNRPGAGGAVGTASVARSKPDGTTLLMAASSHTINKVLDPKLPFDPVKDFTAVAHVGIGSMIVLINARLPVKNVAELIAYAKANPRKLNYASAGVGSATHLAMAYFLGRAAVEMVHVPYKSTAEALTHLVSGEAQALIVPTLGSQAYIDNPAIRLLAVTSLEPMPALKGVPTVMASGLPGYSFTSWFGLLGPANMPADVIAKINNAIVKGLADPALAAKIEQQGIEPTPMSPAAFSDLLAEHFEVIKGIVDLAGLKPEP